MKAKSTRAEQLIEIAQSFKDGIKQGQLETLKEVEKIGVTICKLCGKIKIIGQGNPKDYCMNCYKKIEYYKKREQGFKKPSKYHYKGYDTYKKYLTENPDKKELLHIRQMTFHKYGKAKVCSLCQSEIKVQHHHFIPYNVDNFIDICSKCHKSGFHLKQIPEELKSKLEWKK